MAKSIGVSMTFERSDRATSTIFIGIDFLFWSRLLSEMDTRPILPSIQIWCFVLQGAQLFSRVPFCTRARFFHRIYCFVSMLAFYA